MNGQRPATTQQQLQHLVNQYRQLMQQIQQMGPDAPEAQPLQARAGQIREILQSYQARVQMQRQAQAQAQAQAQGQSPGQQPVPQAQPHPQQPQTSSPVPRAPYLAQPPPQQPQDAVLSGQQLNEQQMRAYKSRQAQLAQMQSVDGVRQRTLTVEELRRARSELAQRIARIEQATPSMSPEDQQRAHQSVMSMRARVEQYMQREVQLMREVQQAVAQRQMKPGFQGQPQPQGQGQPQGQQGQQGQPQVQQGQPQPQPGQPQQGPVQPQGQPQGPVQPQGQPQGPVQQVPPGMPLPPQTQVPQGQGQQIPQGPQGQGPQGQGSQGQGPQGQQIPQGQIPQMGVPPQMGRVRPASSMPIAPALEVSQPTPVSVGREHPTLLNGGAAGGAALNSPALVRIPPFEVSGDRVLSKRRLTDMVSSILGEHHDQVMDGDVEELLLDMADEFVASVTSFACRISKHRKSDVLEAKDIQLHLERNWNMRIPGYAAEDVRSIRKSAPAPSYLQKLNSVRAARISK